MHKHHSTKAVKEKIAIILTEQFTYKYFMRHIVENSNKNFIILGNFSIKDKKGEYVDTGRVKFINIGVNRKKVHLTDFLVFFKILRTLKINKVDKVITCMPKTNVLGQIAAKLLAIKPSIALSTGSLWLSRKGISRIFLLYAEKFVIMLCDIMVADSKSQYELIKKFHPNSKNKFRFVMGLTSRDFNKVNYVDKSKDKIVIGHIGLLNKRKGTDEAIEIAKKCFSYDLTLKFRFIGLVDESKILDSLKDLKLSYPKKVVFKNGLFDFEKEISKIDILLMPSQWEGFGIAAVEAAKLKKIVIGYDVIGLKDSIIKNKTGHRVKYKNQNAIIKLLKMYSEDHYMLRKMQNLSYKISREKFKSSNMTANLKKALEVIN